MREAIDLRIQAPRGIIGKVLQQLQYSCVSIARRWLGGLQEFRSFLTRPCRPYSCRATATLSIAFRYNGATSSSTSFPSMLRLSVTWSADSHSVLGKLDFFFEACMQPLPVTQG